ncbi:MAG: endonuclease/exonuclease/phosphatase family protein [Myxococcales bacterium]|nr:endonuclease/exonuclease/phosphatase family protein [Myxococcales bacterium]
MDVVTWNLNGLEPIDLGPRTEGALFTVLLGGPLEEVLTSGPRLDPPAAVLLQEVVETSFYAHVVPHLRAAGYTIFPERPPERSYFEVIAVRGPVLDAESRPFRQSGMGRELTRVRTPWCTLFTGHLESLGPGRPARLTQTAEVLAALAATEGPALFGGDTNLRQAEWSTVEVPATVRDAWELAGSAPSTAATWGKARYDRVWLKGLTATSFSLLGDRPLDATGDRPSDHLGVRVTVAASA